MLIKATILGCALVSTPLCLATLSQDPVRDADATPAAATPAAGPAAAARSAELEALRAKVRTLQARVDSLHAAGGDAHAQAVAAQAEVAALQVQLRECVNLLERSTDRPRRGNCTPSRTRKILTHYQWMQGNGYEKRAGRLLGQVLKETGKNNNDLNNLASHLLTNKESAGEFDSAALAIAERMEKNGRLRPNQLDTIALAKFLNGCVDEAIAMQTLAIEQGGSGDEYRRRLRVYEAAKNRVAPALAAAGAAAEAVADATDADAAAGGGAR